MCGPAPVHHLPNKFDVRIRSPDRFEPMEFKMLTHRTLITALFSTAVLFGSIGAASASPWTNDHPRRAEINHRLANQDHRINRDLRHGEITMHQARYLHREDRMIRHDERFDARFDHSHVTRAEDRALNQNENGASRQIYRDAH